MPDENDLLYEEEILRNPYSLRMWWRYISARQDVTAKRRYLLYERALRALPGSYKLWHTYLQERRLAVRGLPADHASIDALNNAYERALVTMHKMPRIWLEYIEYLMQQGCVTRTRRTLDRALASLPVTQHDRVWELYLRFVTQSDMPMDTAFRVYRRYLRLEPNHREEYITYLKAKAQWGPAAEQLAIVVNDDGFRSLEGKTKHALWLELCDIVTKHPDDVKSLNADAIIRAGIRKFTNEVGRLWTALADYYIRQGLFERARDVYEEGMHSVQTVRDFTLIFEALTQFEESLVTAQLERLGDNAADAAPAAHGDGSDFLLLDAADDVDLRLERLEWLFSRRPELLSSVMLRQNPHNVQEWHKRVHLFEGDPARQVLTYTEAVKTVDPAKAVGKPHSLWCAFAHFYEKHGDLANARIVFEKAAQARYLYTDDLAHVWCQWAEMELKHNNFRSAMDIMQRAVTVPPTATRRLTPEEQRALTPQEKLYKNARVWSLYTDLVESFATVEETRAVYDRQLDLKVITPQAVLNYGAFLLQHKFWEDAFRVYERGVALFKYPQVEEIWRAYLTQFTDRYRGSKLERARDLFRQATAEAPPDKRKALYFMWADYEERYGLARHCFGVYEAAAAAVPKAERRDVYLLFVDKARALVGVPKVREVFEMAIEAEPPAEVPDEDALDLCTRYAKIERDLGEIDRSRAIWIHAAHLADERRHPGFWKEWEAFEVAHGNEDTFRELMRIRRSVAAAFSAVHYNTTAVEASAEPGAADAVASGGDAMAALEAAAAAPATVPGFVSGGVVQSQAPASAAGDEPAAKKQKIAIDNPEEIDLGDDDED